MRFRFEAVNGPFALLTCRQCNGLPTGSCSTASASVAQPYTVRRTLRGHLRGRLRRSAQSRLSVPIFKAVECVPSSTGHTNMLSMLSTLTDVCSGPVDRSQVATAARRATTAARTARACRAAAARPRYDGTPIACAATQSAAAHARRCEACFGL
jgi:hypothetical protein